MNDQIELRDQERTTPSRRRLLVALAVFLPLMALFALLAWALVESGGQPAGVAINTQFGEVAIEEGPARDFTLTLFDGESLSLSELRGKVVLIDFWTSWCPPCRREAPTLAEAYRRFQGRGVEFVGVAVWDSEEQASGFVRELGVEYPNGLDSKGTIAIDYGLTGIPEKYIVDREGRLVRKFAGPMELDRLEALLIELTLP